MKEKSPIRGLIWKENEGEIGASVPAPEGREKWAEMRRGERSGEPQRPTPDLRVRENGEWRREGEWGR